MCGLWHLSSWPGGGAINAGHTLLQSFCAVGKQKTRATASAQIHAPAPSSAMAAAASEGEWVDKSRRRRGSTSSGRCTRSSHIHALRFHASMTRTSRLTARRRLRVVGWRRRLVVLTTFVDGKLFKYDFTYRRVKATDSPKKKCFWSLHLALERHEQRQEALTVVSEVSSTECRRDIPSCSDVDVSHTISSLVF